MTRLPILFNPAAGRGTKDPDALLRRLPAAHRERVECVPFGAPWDFEPHIAAAQKAGGPIILWGGDGTNHHAMKALRAAGCPVPMASLPGGSGNGLARGLRTPLDPAGALIRLLEGREERIDLGLIDGEPFINLCGTGFEGKVAHAFHQGKGRGLPGYLRDILYLWTDNEKAALTWDAEVPPPTEPVSARERLRAAWDGPEPPLPAEAWSLCFANLPTHGMGLWLTPQANPIDGLLTWSTLRKPGFLDVLTQGLPLFSESGRSALRTQGRVGKTVLQMDRALPWHVDGEPIEARDRAEFRVEPRAFRIQVTDACPWG
ncbi:MAG TPA: diacylglycerol kinase family protein [Holophagaceae bacterium]|nr:diacylglycerol kinase family protein [Holophagaceae bacterium]